MNSSESFRELFFEYHPIVVQTAFFVLNNVNEAEDVAQDVFSKLWEKEDLDRIDNLKAYLRTSAKNLSLNKIKQINRLKGREQQYLSYSFVEGEEAPIDPPKSFLNEIEKVMDKLPPKCRLIFSMSRFEGLSNTQIAEQLDISKRTVETQISVVLKFLRSEFKGRKDEFLPSFIPLLLAMELCS
ncbi:MAG: RNA polymerase sigma-70 factor [Bacteroidota bacterium]